DRLRASLQTALDGIAPLQEYALLHYPYYPNIGDHMIWLGAVSYGVEHRNTTLKYAASAIDFCDKKLAAASQDAPIILSGGGNLGDLWPKEQQFREFIIERYRDRPIISLPQSIYFANPENVARAAQVFNAHPNLTLLTREAVSYQLAQQYFPNSRVLIAPDMAFQLQSLPKLAIAPDPALTLLWHQRQDPERNTVFDPPDINLDIQDWNACEWFYRWQSPYDQQRIWQLPLLDRVVREVWQRRFAVPREWRSRQQWLQDPWIQRWQSLPYFRLQRRSWELLHSAYYQFARYQTVVTDRLHGHILAVMLKIPHLFLPNTYHKNESFYHTWTHAVPYCRFIRNPEDIPAALESLADSS
ncbi:MAG: polysaccharide pyruvyl transferase family protein, partial [Aeromonas sp.]